MNNKDKVRNAIVDCGIIPVIRASSVREALLGVEAVCRGGIRVVEITMTVAGALEAIRHAVKDLGKEAVVGAGTVLDADTARRCLDSGAAFLVSPGFDLEMVALARSEETLVMAGALTPTEIMAATKAGADFVKIFPCGNMGGPDYIRALKAPFPDVEMVPTGGVNLDNADQFVRAGAVALRTMMSPSVVIGSTNAPAPTGTPLIRNCGAGAVPIRSMEPFTSRGEVEGVMEPILTKSTGIRFFSYLVRLKSRCSQEAGAGFDPG